VSHVRAIFTWLYWGILSTLAAATAAVFILSFVQNIPPGVRDSKVLFIKPGSPLKEIARQLSAAEICPAWKLKLLARLTRKQSALKPGEYRFDVPSPPLTLLNTLVEGKVLLHKVTFPEGSTMEEVAHILGSAELVPLEDFRSLLRRKDLLDALQVPGESFEGFLFPDTYQFSKIDGARSILEVLVARFRKALTPDDERQAATLDLNLLQWVTLASIIEKESSVPAEHAIISSVFHNRLKKRMRLQSDPTVIYGIPNFNGNITKKDLQTPTPYNTYTKAGLPPGPVANPGADSLHAAVHPARTDFLYFVARNDGTHAFAKTYEEHVRNVGKYQLARRKE